MYVFFSFYFKGSESNKISIVLKEASHRQKFPRVSRHHIPSIRIVLVDKDRACRYKDRARRQFFQKMVNVLMPKLGKEWCRRISVNLIGRRPFKFN